MRILLVCILIFGHGWLIAQSNDPHLEYLKEFHENEAEYLNQLYLDNPDLNRDEIKQKMREYYRENFNPPMPSFDSEPSIQKITEKADGQTQMGPTAFNQVPDSIEYQALKALFESTNGADWTNSTNWDYPNWKDRSTVTYTDFEDWYGITVTDGDVTDVDLSRNDLTGSIPSELGNLTSLTSLYISNNEISGSIPIELSTLSSLVTLSISQNLLTGTIPPELSSLFSLRYLFLSLNQLSGSLPPELGQLSSLESLYLSNNNLTGGIPSELSNLSALEDLHLSNNQISGPIPPELGNLSALEGLYLNNNQLSGSIPSEFGQLSSLKNLEIGLSQLTGPIPPELGNLPYLMYLILNFNQLTGSIPSELGTSNNSLNSISLNNNLLSGSIPSELGVLSTLLFLNLQNNQFSGTIPPELGNLPVIAQINLYGNRLTGPIPPELGNLTSLTFLSLYGNQLSGSIPQELNNLSQLKTLHLAGNTLSGAVNFDLSSMANLKEIFLGDNNLSGPLDFLTDPNRYVGMTVLNNLFDFKDLEYLFNGQGQPKYSYCYYFPQKTILGDPLNLTFAQNQTITIPFSPDGTHNLYQWQKISGGTWEDITGANSASYEKQNAVLSDAGIYRCKVTNGWVTGLTLYSHEITVNIMEGLPDPPVADSVNICPGQTATLTASGSGTIYWFSAETGGDTVAIGSSFTTPVLTESVTYYVSREVDGIHSERIPVAALVGPLFTVTPDTSICKGTDIALSIEGDDFTVDWGQYGIGPSIVVEPDTTTVYPYTIENPYGCSASGQITVTVLDSLIAEILPPPRVCPGDPVTLEAGEVPGATYSWEPGGLTGRTITVQHNELQEYTLTVTNSAGCSSTASAFVRFAAMAVASEDQTICVTDSVVLEASGGDSYLWSTGDTTSQITFNPEAAGEYTFTVAVTTDSCTASEDVTVTVVPYCPGMPISFVARGISTSEIALQWKEPAGNQEQYVIQRRNDEGTYETVETILAGTHSWQDSNLEPDKRYYYRIYARVATAQSNDSHGSARTFRPNENFIHEVTVFKAGVTDPSSVPGLGSGQRSSSWTYLNGLGAEMQLIGEGASPSGKDIVQPVIYDKYGMVSKQYLPTRSARQTLNFGEKQGRKCWTFMLPHPQRLSLPRALLHPHCMINHLKIKY